MDVNDLETIRKAERIEILSFAKHDRVKLIYPKGYPLKRMVWNLKCRVTDLDEPYRSEILAKAS